MDYGEMTRDEGVELISLLRKLFPVMKRTTRAQRVYSVAMMEGAPHFHLWLVPRGGKRRLRGVQFLASRHKSPTANEAAMVAAKIRRDLGRGGK